MVYNSIYNNPDKKNFRKSLRKTQTEAERKIWNCVRNKKLLGLKFFRQYSVGDYILDLYCPFCRLAIEVDGGQHSREADKSHDKLRTEFLNENHIKVLRFWNNEVLNNIDGVIQVITTELNSSRPPLASRGGEKDQWTL